ncbi:hypothetical protein VO64_2317 [Pseudomonas synxantha]|uniref:Uncharacterized protein n=1 Tax=Pseudomonas synxantha TaxID=47883 RepID=A0AAU8TKB3_9PSED|nr:hypothetical protein VO64_2317 [Pseudomonas synxantha]
MPGLNFLMGYDHASGRGLMLPNAAKKRNRAAIDQPVG